MPTTLGQIQDRVNEDFINRTDMNTQVRRAIQASIRHYERQRFWFNETATVSTASAGDRNVPLPSNLLELDLIEVTENSATYQLHEVSLAEIREMNTQGADSQGLPTYYAVFDDKLELSLIPNSAYSVTIHYLKQFSGVSATSDTNDMLTHFEEVITYRSAKIIWATVLRNEKEAAVCASLEREAFAQMNRQRDMRAFSKITPTEF